LFEGKCLKDGLRNGAEVSIPVGLPIVIAGHPSVGGVGLGCQPVRFAAAASFGALGSVLPDRVLSDSKKPAADFPARA
jgi:hypothetical protein